ncbi:MAG: hypothetical protein PHU04_01810 [Candidatus Peribacteraceae bacterium]|nr:hypothetical protein [Candidatus Peribacteraceae bacterium]
MTNLRHAPRLSPGLLLILGTSVVALAISDIPQAAAASDETIAVEQTISASATDREALRRAAIRQRMHSNTRSYATLIEDAAVPSEPALQASRSTGHKARVLCRVKDRYTDPNVLPITKQRLVERVAENLSLSPGAVTEMLAGSLHCEEVLNGLYPYLFYAGDPEQEPGTPAPVPSPIPTPVQLPGAIGPSQEEAPAAAAPSLLPSAAIAGTSTPPQEDAAVPATAEEVDGVLEGDSALTQEAMLRTLCRLRERGLRDAAAFEESIPDVSARFAERWNVDLDSIASALRNSALCSKPESITLTAQPSAAVEEEPAEVFGPPAPGSEAQEPGAGANLLNRIKALPPIILAIGGLTLLTFIALIILIILPLFVPQE